ncbi:MAG: 2-oxoacid:acceptor oxidoreductase subunit alpha [Candidatus Omnitrophota bacterium]
MKDELSIRVCGEAGQGVQTIGEALCAIYKDAGLNIFANQDNMSRIRGGNNFFQLRIASQPLYTLRQKVDIVVALDKESVMLHAPQVNPGGILVLDREKFGISEENSLFFDLPFYDISVKTGGSGIFVNSVCCGFLSAITGVEFSCLETALKKVFAAKSDEIIGKNLETARAGYDFVQNNPSINIFRVQKSSSSRPHVMDGNQAIALGAIRAGCKFYTAYPMSPSTSIMDTLARYADKFNIIVEQAEDEIGAINMALGASFAGVRAMTGTSGGGFSLMVEGVSLSGMTETPVVIVVAQRPGPATGFPTRTEQSDLNFVLHAGHGEFARVVFTPGTVEECFYLAVKAFNLAEKYQIPVFILTDQHLAESLSDINSFEASKAEVRRYIISKSGSAAIKDYKRYALTDSGISPRAIPSWIDEAIYVDSDEHTEEGHITEDAIIRNAMVEKRLYKKLSGLKLELEKPTFENMEGAGLIIVGFGSTYGVLKEAARETKSGFIHLSQVWPFPADDMAVLLKNAKKIVTVENNAGAQLAGLIRRETGIKVDKSILKFDGRPFDLDYLIERINKEL